MKYNLYQGSRFASTLTKKFNLLSMLLVLVCSLGVSFGQRNIQTLVVPNDSTLGYGDSLKLDRVVVKESNNTDFPLITFKPHIIKLAILGDYDFSSDTANIIISLGSGAGETKFEKLYDFKDDTLYFSFEMADEVKRDLIRLKDIYIKPETQNTSPSCSLLVILDSASTGNIIVHNTIGLFDMVSPSLEVTFDSTACDKQTYSLSAKIINAGSLWAI